MKAEALASITAREVKFSEAISSRPRHCRFFSRSMSSKISGSSFSRGLLRQVSYMKSGKLSGSGESLLSANTHNSAPSHNRHDQRHLGGLCYRPICGPMHVVHLGIVDTSLSMKKWKLFPTSKTNLTHQEDLKICSIFSDPGQVSHA